MILVKPLFNMSRPTSPTFKTVLSVPHYNLSAHTFAMHTLSLHQISSIIDLLSSDPVATHDLLTLDQVDQTVLNMEWQLDEQHLAVWRFSTLITHNSASQIPQHIHEIKQPDCWKCCIQQQCPTPHPQHRLQPIIIHDLSSESPSSSSSSIWEQYRWMPSYPRWSPAIPIASTSTAPTIPFPQMATQSDWVLAWTWFEANAPDYLQRLQTVPEEQWLGTADFLIVVKSSEAEEDIFKQYYHWFINERHD